MACKNKDCGCQNGGLTTPTCPPLTECEGNPCAQMWDSKCIIYNITEPKLGVTAGDTLEEVIGKIADKFDGRSIFTKIPVPFAEVRTLFTSPKQLLPSAGIGTAIDVTHAVGRLRYGTITYTVNLLLGIYSDTGTIPLLRNVGLLGSTATSIKQFEVTDQEIHGSGDLVENEGIVLKSLIADPELGDSDLDIYLVHRVVTL